MRVRLAKQLADDARDAVGDEEGAGHRARPLAHAEAPLEDRQHREDADALEERLVELARMARLGAAMGKTMAQGTSLARP